ncbi:ribonuclease H [Phyllobacterium sp. YR531]|uniref:ribonuclease H family protein n=1 Tax=Phyllobacterium sp. YR531 TaxID=1144343 RepID=UPI001FCC0D6A|nr:ribonuclease H [Phyllobacterium sp. YR531]
MLHRGFHVFVDGCFKPVSQNGGWAFVAYRDSMEIACDFGAVANSSNNATEAVAVLQAMRWINANIAVEPAVIWSDSVYAVTGCNYWLPIWKANGWKKPAPNPNLRRRTIANDVIWKEIHGELSRNPLISIVWCKGHSGIPGNERADALADEGRRFRVPGTAVA